jgi:hypothetical protein
MTVLRLLTEKGVGEFTGYIQDARNDSGAVYPDLNTGPYSKEFQIHIEIDETKTFTNRMEMARYLSSQFADAGIKRDKILGEGTEGLWTWLAYIWFRQLTDQIRKVQRTERYICSSDWNRYYIHLVAGAYYLFSSQLGEDKSRLFLCTPPYILNDFNDHMACYQYIVGYPNIVEVAHHLYWDNENSASKKGAQSKKKPGNIRRFSKMINQLELTHDVYSMEPDQIIRLLPHEFHRWK